MTTQKDAIRINYIKAKVDNTQQKSKYGLCGERYETVNHKSNKLPQKKYRIRHDWEGKVIH